MQFGPPHFIHLVLEIYFEVLLFGFCFELRVNNIFYDKSSNTSVPLNLFILKESMISHQNQLFC